MPQFYPDFDVISKKQKKNGLRSSTYWFLSVISMGPLKPTGPMMGPLKSIGPGLIVPAAPPSRRPWRRVKVKKK